MEARLWQRGAILMVLCLGVAATYAPTVAIGEKSDVLTVRFLDVGQGDAIHITTPDQVEVLIDGGADGQVLRSLAEGRNFFDRSIDVLVETHPDTDHVGGLVDVLSRYDIETIVTSGAEHDAPAAAAFDIAAAAEGAQLLEARSGQLIGLGASTTMLILSPQSDPADWRTNVASAVILLRYGDTAFMLTGDAPKSIEDYLAGAYGAGLKADVLKLGHHGSDTSTSELFLETVDPTYAVVSASSDNRYGHPHAEVLARTIASGAEIISTAEQGTITFVSDGQSVSLSE